MYQKSNVLIVTAFKEYAAIAFFKGALLDDSNGILVAPGENSQSARQVRFTNVKDIIELEPVLRTYIYEAIEVEKSGLKVAFKRDQEQIPEELQAKFEELPALKSAFEALTPGRQRGYILHFSQAKQSKTRESRIEKCIEKILMGKGINGPIKPCESIGTSQISPNIAIAPFQNKTQLIGFPRKNYNFSYY